MVESSEGLPEQSDSGSCGIFDMAAADCFAVGLPTAFCQDDMPVLRQRMGAALFVDSLTVAEPELPLPVGAEVGSEAEKVATALSAGTQVCGATSAFCQC